MKGRDNDAEAPRVINDVDCIGAILTLRAGRHPRSMDSARAVLATTAAKMVNNATKWFRDQGEPGIPPVVHLAALTSIAWLKKPAAAADLKVQELIALCGAALKPSTSTWDRFFFYLRNAKADGSLTTDEEVAILASELTDGQLSHLSDVSDDPDAATIAEVVARVRNTYGERSAQIQAEADAKIKNLQRQHEDDSARTALKAEAMAAARRAAEERAELNERELQKVRDAVRSKARRAAAVTSWCIYLVIAGAVVYATWHVGGVPQDHWKSVLWRLGGLVIVGLGVAGTLFGTHLGQVRSRISEKLETWITQFLLAR